MLSVFKMQIVLMGNWPNWQAFLSSAWRPQGLPCLLTLLSMSVVGLLAIWTGLGRRHWFLRAAALLASISLLTTIPAYELVIVYLVQAVLTIIVLAVWRNWRRARSIAAAPDQSILDRSGRLPWQFTVLDMLLLAVCVAWTCGMLVKAPRAVWAGWPWLLAEGAVTAVFTIGAAWIALSNSRWWLRLLAMVPLLPAAIMTAWLSLWRGATRSTANSRWQAYRRRLSQAVLVGASLAMLVPLAAVGWRLAHPHTFSEPARPVPNGYDELVAAADLIKNVNVPDFETATHSQFRTYVAQCSPVYAPTRTALGKTCQVPPRSTAEDFYSKCLTQVQSLRATARAFYAQGRLATMDGRKHDAIESYIDNIRLGRATMHGGLFVDMLVGVTSEGMGLDGIARMRKSLTAEECLSLLPRLSDLTDHATLTADCLAREAAWSDNAYGWQGRLIAVIDEFVDLHEAYHRAIVHVSNRELAYSRLLVCDLAIRAYRLQQGHYPATLADLTPRYLPKVPKDPFDGGEFVYVPTPSGFDLHSRQLGAQGKPISVDDPG